MENKGIIGTVCGDIIGSPYEFHSTKKFDFELITPRSKFTDDTVMTCAVAEWLMDDPNHSHKKLIEIMHRYGEEYPNVGYGGMFKKWLENHCTEPYNSFGNGSAMRVSPVAYYAKSLEEALQLAEISAEVTHNHPEGIIGAKAVAAAIFIMREDGGLPHYAWERVEKYIEKYFFYKLHYTMNEWEEHIQNYKFDVTCQGSVPEAINCAMGSIDYEYCIRQAVTLGGDADTQAAITGGVVAAYRPVPNHILEPCLERLDPPLVDTIEQFNSFCKRRLYKPRKKITPEDRAAIVIT